MDRPRLAGGPWLAWLSVELLGRLPSGLIRPLPVDIGRFRYRRSGFVARRSAEDLPPFRAPEQAVRDTALSLKRRSRNLRPARNPNVYAVPIRLMQTHTTCRMLPLAILRTQSAPSHLNLKFVA